MESSKHPLASKTLWINALVLLAAVLNEILPVVQDETLTRTVMALTILNIVLRYLTKVPVSTKKG